MRPADFIIVGTIIFMSMSIYKPRNEDEKTGAGLMILIGLALVGIGVVRLFV